MPPATNSDLGRSSSSLLGEALRERGFARDGRVYRRDDFAFAASGRWYVLSDQATGLSGPSFSRGLGQPGLWKWVQNGASPHRVFEIPSWAVGGQLEDDRLDESGPAPFAKLLDWALATSAGVPQPDWQPPAADQVGSWLAPGALTVQAKGCVRRGEMLLNPGPPRWALRLPILPRWPEDLPAARRRALEELAAEAQRHWAMVRLGVTAETSPAALIAEVDFTGAPHSELLFSAGLDALKHVAAWSVETAEVLADPTVALACLALDGISNTNPNRRNIV